MKLLSTLTFLSLTILANSQDCQHSEAIIQLDVNRIKADLRVAGDLWWDGANSGYVAPVPEEGEPEVTAIFAGGLWLGGIGPNGNLKTAISMTICILAIGGEQKVVQSPAALPRRLVPK